MPIQLMIIYRVLGVLFLVLAADFLIRFKIVRTKKGGGENGNG